MHVWLQSITARTRAHRQRQGLLLCTVHVDQHPSHHQQRDVNPSGTRRASLCSARQPISSTCSRSSEVRTPSLRFCRPAAVIKPHAGITAIICYPWRRARSSYGTVVLFLLSASAPRLTKNLRLATLSTLYPRSALFATPMATGGIPKNEETLESPFTKTTISSVSSQQNHTLISQLAGEQCS